MKAYEYLAKVLPDGHLPMPENLRDKINPYSKIRVMPLVPEAFRSILVPGALTASLPENSPRRFVKKNKYGTDEEKNKTEKISVRQHDLLQKIQQLL